MAALPKSPLYSDDDQETKDYLFSRLPKILQIAEVDIQISRSAFNWLSDKETSFKEGENLPEGYEKVKKIIFTKKIYFKVKDCAKVAFCHLAELNLQLKDYETSKEDKVEWKMVFMQILRDRVLEDDFGKEELESLLLTCKKIVCYVSLETSHTKVFVEESRSLAWAAHGGQLLKISFNLLLKAYLWQLAHKQ